MLRTSHHTRLKSFKTLNIGRRMEKNATKLEKIWPLESVLSNQGITNPSRNLHQSKEQFIFGGSERALANRCQNWYMDWWQVKCMIGFYQKKISVVSIPLILSFEMLLWLLCNEVNFVKNRPSLKIVLVPLHFFVRKDVNNKQKQNFATNRDPFGNTFLC